MSSELDRPGAVRPGEELDPERLAAFLAARIPHLTGPLEVEQFPSGYSNLTYLVRAGERELVLRRPPFGTQVKSAHDMGREYRILRALEGVYSKAPRPLLYCDDTGVIGAPFYLMERVRGVILRPSASKVLVLGPDALKRRSEAFIDGLAELHSLD